MSYGPFLQVINCSGNLQIDLTSLPDETVVPEIPAMIASASRKVRTLAFNTGGGGTVNRVCSLGAIRNRNVLQSESVLLLTV